MSLKRWFKKNTDDWQEGWLASDEKIENDDFTNYSFPEGNTTTDSSVGLSLTLPVEFKQFESLPKGTDMKISHWVEVADLSWKTSVAFKEGNVKRQ